MSTELKFLVASWVALGMVVIALAIYRKILIGKEDVNLHVLDGDAAMIPGQAVLAQRVEKIDRWGKFLTAVELLYGLAIGGMYLYGVWMVSQKTFWSE